MTIADYDHLEATEKRSLLFQCCGSRKWVDKMLDLPPAEDLIDLFEDAEEMWYDCNEEDWKEAFTHHPMIGDLDSLQKKFSDDRFARSEQTAVVNAADQVLQALVEGNKAYNEKFGYIFIVYANGKSVEEILDLLNERLENTPEEEIKIAMDEQNNITKLRLEKLLET